MKHFLLVLLFSLSAFCVKAQAYFPFPDSATTWIDLYEMQSSPSNYYATYETYIVGGDTLIGTHIYHKLAGPNCTGGVRNDTAARIVYFAGDCLPTISTGTNEIVLYRWDLQVGDTAYVDSDFGPQIISTVDSVLINGQYRERYRMGIDEWIQGIGSTAFPLRPFFTEFEWNWTLMCVETDTTHLFTYGVTPSNNYPSHQQSNITCLPTGIVNEPALPVLSADILPANEGRAACVKIYGAEGEVLVSVYDMQGKEIFSEKNAALSETIDMSSFVRGLYIFRISDSSGKMISKKFIQQ